MKVEQADFDALDAALDAATQALADKIAALELPAADVQPLLDRRSGAARAGRATGGGGTTRVMMPRWPEQECLHEDTDRLMGGMDGDPIAEYCNDCGAQVLAAPPAVKEPPV